MFGELISKMFVKEGSITNPLPDTVETYSSEGPSSIQATANDILF